MIIAILKPGKDSAIPKNYRPISLLCHTYKLYERMILNRLAPVVGQRLIKQQTGFRTGMSCTSQLLNLTQHIEDGYQRGMITGAAFVDLSAAYDTVNHRILIQKLYNITQDSPLCRVIQNMLSSRRFYVELNNELSTDGETEGRPATGKCPVPHPFQHLHYDQPLHNKEAKRTLKVKWNRTYLENTLDPKYLSVTLDQTLSYKQHIHNTNMKVTTRNNLLRKLSSSKWGTSASSIRTTALALSYSVAEYAATVWARSCLQTGFRAQ